MAKNPSSGTEAKFKWLKKAGLISYPSFDSLTSAQRGRVTALANKYSEIQARPSNFVLRKVESKETQRILKAAGFSVVNGRAIVKADFDATVRITKTKVVIDGKYNKREIYLSSGPGFLRKVEDGTFERMPIRTGQQTWGWTIGARSYGRTEYEDFAEFRDYLESYMAVELDEMLQEKIAPVKTTHKRLNETVYAQTFGPARRAEIKAKADNTKFRK